MKKNTIGLILKSGTSTTYTQLIKIYKYPDMGKGIPDMLDATSTDDETEQQEPGVRKLSAMEFEGYYDDTNFDTALTNEGVQQNFQFLDSDGKGWSWTGKYYLTELGGGVNELRKVKLTVSRNSAMTRVVPTQSGN